MSCATSESTSAMRISMRSSPLFFRTTMSPGSSSMTVGGVIQFWGLKPPVSACTITDPSDFSISSRSASGRMVESRPE